MAKKKVVKKKVAKKAPKKRQQEATDVSAPVTPRTRQTDDDKPPKKPIMSAEEVLHHMKLRVNAITKSFSNFVKEHPRSTQAFDRTSEKINEMLDDYFIGAIVPVSQRPTDAEIDDALSPVLHYSKGK